ncbi:hypothetical protein J2T11_000159 [Paenarthrobacter nicotinovorans]|uniref:hypothetical protein n=1 Tax=Paenarthrobacter nicotinovorans TaxID=29320 RepID=UPI002785EBC9|nr:hypothetical protein [Paenarthrobacter nicotinovorans]MDP9933835.1 hypothetical protein [Paenarthrobacter nicotinovorans]
MKLSIVPIIMLAFAMTACSAPPATSSAANTASSPAVTKSAAPTSTAALEPTSLKEAILNANKGNTEPIDAVGAMEDLYGLADRALRPGMTESSWGKIEIIRINTSLGMLKDTLSDREIILGVNQYVAMMEVEAIRQGKA